MHDVTSVLVACVAAGVVVASRDGRRARDNQRCARARDEGASSDGLARRSVGPRGAVRQRLDCFCVTSRGLGLVNNEPGSGDLRRDRGGADGAGKVGGLRVECTLEESALLGEHAGVYQHTQSLSETSLGKLVVGVGGPE